MLLGYWRATPDTPPPERLRGYRPLRIAGRHLAVVIASDFERPPPELPIRYQEVIAATLVRRGLRLSALPLSMWLNEPLPVELGHTHYSMPKRLDPQLEVTLTGPELRLGGLPRADGDVVPGWLAALCMPLSLLLWLGLWLGSRLTPVIGAADLPVRSVVIGLSPHSPGRPVRISQAQMDGLQLRVLWSQRYAFNETNLGPPRQLE